jgi:CubicO group peptidase (beta-lactamase class C family)
MAGLQDAFELIGDAAEHHLPQTHAAGIALGVTDHEELLGIVVRGFADVAAQQPVRPDTRFQIGSISKQFSSIVVMQEAEAGRLDLHVSINRILPWLELPEPFGPITLHHLLTHTSGLPQGMEEAPAGPGAVVVIRDAPPTFPPGDRFHYSNTGYKLVGYALEQVTGVPIHELLRERVLGPLGMRHSQADITPESYLSTAVGYEPMFDDRPPHLNHPLGPAPRIVSNTADGSIVSTVADMAAYARMLIGAGTTVVDEHEVQVLSAEMFDMLVEGRVDSGERGERYAYGLDVWTHEDGRRFLAHTGGMVGYTAHLVVDRDSGLACIALQNGGGDKDALVRYAIEAVRASVNGMPVAPAAHPPAPTELPKADELAGIYVGEPTIELQRTSDGLRLVDGALGVLLERWPDTEDAFSVPHPSWDRFLLRVVRDDDGAVTELTHGPARFAPEGRELVPGDDPDPTWEGFTGFYRSNDPWSPTLRVFLRGGRLWSQQPAYGAEEPLTPLDDGSFAGKDPMVPNRWRFEHVIDGRAMSVWMDGGRLYRSFEG